MSTAIEISRQNRPIISGLEAPATRTQTWLNVVSHLDPKYGGLSSAVPALASSVAAAGKFSVALSGFCVEGERFAPEIAEGIEVHHFPLGRFNWLRDTEAREAFRRLVKGSAGLHIHGLWELSTLVAARTAHSQRKPYILSAHGMLESWAIANKRLKKKVYAALFENANLRNAACLHALTRAEAQDYRNSGLRNPIAIIPNGVNLPPTSSREIFLRRFPELANKRLILFLGRIHFKKGVDILCEAWQRVSAKWPEAHLVLAGPDFENTQAEIKNVLDTLQVGHRVTFTGMLNSELKWSAISASDFFVLPSYSEGLSVSVLEAMGMGLPVIITAQCNLPEVTEHSCGWVIQPRAYELESAINIALEASSSDRAKLGANGRRLVAERYSWPVIGEQMTALYSWIQGGPIPRDIEIEGRL